MNSPGSNFTTLLRLQTFFESSNENTLFLFINSYCVRIKIYNVFVIYFKNKECIPVRCVPSAAVAMYIPAYTGRRGVSAQRGVCPGRCLPGGCLPRESVSTQGDVGVSAQGVSTQEGGVCLGGCVYPSMHWGRHPATG